MRIINVGQLAVSVRLSMILIWFAIILTSTSWNVINYKMIRQTKNNLIFIMKCIQTEKQTQAFYNIVEEKMVQLQELNAWLRYKW